MGIELIDWLEPRGGALRLKIENRAPDRKWSMDAEWKNTKPKEDNRWRGGRQGVGMGLIMKEEHVLMFEMVAKMKYTGN